MLIDARQELGPPPLEVEFPIHSQVFFTGTMTYGHLSEIIGYSKKNLIIRIAVCFDATLLKTLYSNKNNRNHRNQN